MQENFEQAPANNSEIAQSHPSNSLLYIFSLLTLASIVGIVVLFYQNQQLQNQINQLQNQNSSPEAQQGFAEPNQSPDPSESPANAADNDSTQSYTSDQHNFRIQYPAEWYFEEFQNGTSVGFGPPEIREDVIWGVTVYDINETTAEDVISQIGSQFSDRNQDVTETMVGNLPATKVITTTEDIGHWYSEVIVIEQQSNIYTIGNGAVADENLRYMLAERGATQPDMTFEEFYRTFELIN